MIDIQAGDVVKCVDTRPNPPGNAPIKSLGRGRIYRVSRVAIDTFDGTPILMLAGVVSDTVTGGYAHWRFRKITKASDDFCERLKSIHPTEKRKVEV